MNNTKYYDSTKFKPKHGTRIFLWDAENDKEVMVNAFWHPLQWGMNRQTLWDFPVWRYVLDDEEPIAISERENNMTAMERFEEMAKK